MNDLDHTVSRCWLRPGLFSSVRRVQIDEWVESRGGHGVRWLPAGGWSKINGRTYFILIEFENEEDRLLCKLLFSDILE
jgi:hypothetical protein